MHTVIARTRTHKLAFEDIDRGEGEDIDRDVEAREGASEKVIVTTVIKSYRHAPEAITAVHILDMTTINVDLATDVIIEAPIPNDKFTVEELTEIAKKRDYIPLFVLYYDAKPEDTRGLCTHSRHYQVINDPERCDLIEKRFSRDHTTDNGIIVFRYMGTCPDSSPIRLALDIDALVRKHSKEPMLLNYFTYLHEVGVLSDMPKDMCVLYLRTC